MEDENKPFYKKPVFWSCIVGVISLIGAFCVYFGIEASTPRYEMIKGGKIASRIENYDENNNVNSEKYYTFKDDGLFSFKNDDGFGINFSYLINDNSTLENYVDYNVSFNIGITLMRNGVTSNVNLSEVPMIKTNFMGIENGLSLKNPYTKISLSGITFNKNDDVTNYSVTIVGDYKDTDKNSISYSINYESIILEVLAKE